MKKIIILTLFPAILSLTASPSITRYVNADGGLRMRTTPDLNGTKLMTIPNNSEVTVIEEKGNTISLSGKNGKWTKVSYNNTEGWVFGGFLADSKIENIELILSNQIFTASKDLETGAEKLSKYYIIFNPDGTFEGSCLGGHYSGSTFSGRWKMNNKTSVKIYGMAETTSYSETTRTTKENFNATIEFKLNNGKWGLYTYTNNDRFNHLTPCGTTIENGVWTSEIGNENKYWETDYK